MHSGRPPVHGAFFDAECEHFSAARPADAIARTVPRESTCFDAGKVVGVGGAGGRGTSWQNGRVRSFGGSRQSQTELDRTSHEGLCPTARQTSLAFFGYPQFEQLFKKTSQSLEVQLVFYQRRHSRASIDRATKFRSLAEVKRRSGWKQDKSVARYEKGSRLGFSAQQLPATLTVHGDECERRLEDILIHVRTIALPVWIGRVQLRRGAMSQMLVVDMEAWVEPWNLLDFLCDTGTRASIAKETIATLQCLNSLRETSERVKPSCVCSRLQLRLSASRSAVQPWFEEPCSLG